MTKREKKKGVPLHKKKSEFWERVGGENAFRTFQGEAVFIGQSNCISRPVKVNECKELIELSRAVQVGRVIPRGPTTTMI